MRKRTEKQIVVIGLGHFGAGLARVLARHCEVLALDIDIARVDAIAEDVQRALCLDARDFNALASVVSSDFDEAVVSIGESLEGSILCTLHLKRIGVPVIRAKANSADHATILRSVGAEHIIFPEQETAERLALQMLNPNLLDFIPLAKDYRVMDIAAPVVFQGKSLVSLQIRTRFGLFVIAIKKHNGATFEFLPGPEYVIEPEDVLVTIGREIDLIHVRDAPGDVEPAVTPNRGPQPNHEGAPRSDTEALPRHPDAEEKTSGVETESSAPEPQGASPNRTRPASPVKADQPLHERSGQKQTPIAAEDPGKAP